MNCPACLAKRLHTEPEWAEHHPFNRHGYTRESKWTHPDLDAKVPTEAGIPPSPQLESLGLIAQCFDKMIDAVEFDPARPVASRSIP